ITAAKGDFGVVGTDGGIAEEDAGSDLSHLVELHFGQVIAGSADARGSEQTDDNQGAEACWGSHKGLRAIEAVRERDDAHHSTRMGEAPQLGRLKKADGESHGEKAVARPASARIECIWHERIVFAPTGLP